MTELAIDADGDPFEVPEHIVGWRLRRLHPDGRGRPELVYDAAGRPVVLPVHASFTDVAAAAGPGRYRLDPVNQEGRVDDKVPTGVTGYMQSPDAAPPRPANENAHAHAPRNGMCTPAQAAHPPMSEMGQLLASTIEANTRLATMVITQFSGMVGSAGQLIAAADGASITTRLPPPPPPPPPPAAEPVWEDYPEQASGPDWIQTLISQVAPVVLPMLIAKLPALMAKLPGLPLAALFDWRKAAPAATADEAVTATSATSGAPLAAAPQPMAAEPAARFAAAMAAQLVAAQVVSARQRADSTAPAAAPEPPAPAAGSDAIARATDAHTSASVARAITTADPTPSAPATAAHAPSAPATAPHAPSGPALAAPPATAPPPSDTTRTTAAPRPTLDAAITAHITQIWQILSPPEQARATRLIALLTEAERAAWIAELAGMGLAEAVSRVRTVIAPTAPPSGPKPGPATSGPAKSGGAS